MNKKLKLLTGVWLMLLSVSPAFAQLHYSVNKNLAVIRVPGADSTLRILHISDSHITFPDERDKKYEVYSKRMASAYLNEVDAQTGTSVMGAEAFAKLMDKAVAQKVDLIALTGDIVNYPSEHAVDFVMKQLERTHTPFVYVSGNHDWHLEGMPGSDFEQREIWRPKMLKSLYQGNDYDCSARVIKGVDVVAIDNSFYQVSAKQLEFYRKEKTKGLPIVLLMHIPVYTEYGDKSSMGYPKWGAAVDDSYQLERRERWSEKGNSQETLDFCNEIRSTQNVIVLAGHVHHDEVDAEGGMLQIISDISRRAYARIIEIRP